MTDFSGSRIDHLNLAVPDLDRSLAFYVPVLAAIGIDKLLAITDRDDIPAMHGFGVWPKPFFWLIADGQVGSNMHLAFTVDDRSLVERFHEAALASGGTSLLAPGVRPEYHPDYFGGFVLDPDGINLEAVCHQPG